MDLRFRKILTALLSVYLLTALPLVSVAQQKEKREKKEQTENRKDRKPGKRNSDFILQPGNIIPGCPTDQSITLSIVLARDQEAFVEYGTEPNKYTGKSGTLVAFSSGPVVITINGLRPATRYYYRLKYRDRSEGTFHSLAESWFATQALPSGTFTFGLQGDSHPERNGKMFNPDLYRRTIDSVAALKPDFYFLMGDDFSIDRLIQNNTVTRPNVEMPYMLQRSYLGNSGSNPPLFLVNGNHEQAARYLVNGTDSSAPVLAANARNKYFPLPDPGSFYTGDRDSVPYAGLLHDYYAFEWGNALFIVIDPYWHSDVPVDNQPGAEEKKGKKDPWGITLGEVQYQWFKKTLENSRAKYKFVFSHHVSGTGRGGVERARLFEWGGYGQNGSWQFDRFRKGWDTPIHQLMVKNKVTVFFQGHDHLFARQELDGVIYQTVPNPADDTYTSFNREAYTSGEILPNSGFLSVTVAPLEVTVRYVRTYLGETGKLPGDATKTFSYTIR